LYVGADLLIRALSERYLPPPALPRGPPPGDPALPASKQNPEVLWMALERLPPAHLAACGCTQINLIWLVLGAGQGGGRQCSFDLVVGEAVQ
jgi:hypothetical protein